MRVHIRIIAAALIGLTLSVPASADLKKLGVTPFAPKPVMDALRRPSPDITSLSRILCTIPRHEQALLTLDQRAAPPKTLQIQQALAFFGFDPGPLDGLPGPTTRKAATAYASALFGPERTCLHWREAKPLVESHTWSKTLGDVVSARIVHDHGRLGLVRTFYGRNQPKPRVVTDPAHDDCKAHDNAALLGQTLLAARRMAAGVEELRVIRILEPMAMTMDYRPWRLNLEFDGFDRVNTISCG